MGQGNRCWMLGVGLRIALATAAILMLGPSSAGAQDAMQRILVTDGGGAPVPYAVVSVAAGRFAIADDSGRLSLRGKLVDSLRVEVRRMGFQPFRGWVKRNSEAEYVVQLPGPVRLSTVTVTERMNTPLARTGFYDRAERVKRGAIVGTLISPEELDTRNQSQLSRLVHGVGSVRASRFTRGTQAYAVILGRGGCAMTVIVDGQVLKGTAQDNVTEDTPTSMYGQGVFRMQRGEQVDSTAPSVDQLVDLRSAMAVEVYPSGANLPEELQRFAARGGCGIVAVWTGPRQ